MFQVAVISGPALGGFAYAVGAGAALRAHGGLLADRQRPERRDPARGAGRATGRSRGSAISSPASRFVRSDKAILGTISLDLFAVLLGGATALMPIYARDILHTGPWGLGVLRAAPAVGALAMTGAARAPQRSPAGSGMRMLQAVIVFGLGTLVFALSRNMALTLAALVVMGAADTVSVVIRHIAGAAAHARRDARAGGGGELPLHQRLEPARRVRERHDGGALRHGAGGGARRARHDRRGAALDAAFPGAPEGRAAGVGVRRFAAVASVA